MRDQHDGRAMLRAQALQQRDDLRLHRNIERRGRLVRDDELRLGGERERQHDALAHAAGKLVRIVVDARVRRRDADLFKQRERPFSRRGFRQRRVRADGFDQLLADPVERVEAGERVLEHHADALAADLAHRLGRQIVDPLAAQQHLPARDAAGRLDQPDHRRAGDRLAGAGLADHAEHFAGPDVERDVVDGGENPAPGRKLDLEVLHAEDGGHRSFGFSASRSQSPSRLMDSASNTRSSAGKSKIHHSPENRNCWPTRIRVPSEGCVGGTPTPRNESVDSAMIASARLIVAITSTGPMTLGST